VLARTASPPIGPLTAVFNGLDQPGITDATDPTFGGTPADSTGAIGPSNYVEAVNSEIAVYSNTNLSTPTSTLDGSTFVGDPVPGSTCDFQIQWDQAGQRWLYAALDCAASPGTQGFYFGWSKTADPEPLSSNWCRYLVSTGTSEEEYPRLGHDDSQIIVGTNAYAHDGLGIYKGSHIFVLDKPANGVNTCPTGLSEEGTMLEAGISPSDFTPVPANIADHSATGYVVSARSYSDQAHIDLYTVGRVNGANAVLGTTDVTVLPFAVPASVPQPGGTGDTLDSLDTRLTQAVALTDPATGAEGIWTQHTIDGGGPSVVRWYELTPGSPTPYRAGTVSGLDGAFAFNGAISPTENGGGAVLTYNSGSAASDVDWRARDLLAAPVDDVRLAMSSDVDHDLSCPSFGLFGDAPCRWGAYAGASPDPANPCVAWGTTMLTVATPDAIGDPQWGTQNAAIDASSGTCEVTAGVVKTGSGSGTVTSSPAGVDCGPTCSHAFDAGTPVTLTATPATGSVFSGWSGACSGTGLCDLTMDRANAVTATFTAIPESLTVTKSGQGSGTVVSSPTGLRCGSTCSYGFDYGTSVTLTETPSTGSTFIGWSGACSGIGPCIVSMTQARSVFASFSLQTLTLTVSKAGFGTGTVSSNPPGISCGQTCHRNFLYGTIVTLSATPAAGSLFSGWSGACSGVGSCVVTMSQARAATAKFARERCVVPKLRGKRLVAANRALRDAHCTLGKITRVYSQVIGKGRVISLKPKAGTHAAAGARVNLTVSKGQGP
jgi:List-Bact-rpt repeat protein/PASTA domain-containing protein